MRALVMAGGEGRRLRPLTQDIPKPMLRVGNKPILEHLLVRLKSSGIDRVTLSVAHLASKIESHFGSGESFGMEISYVHETVPLGTAGALSFLQDFNDTFFMMNGDILTDLDFHLLLSDHRAKQASLTVASKVMHTPLSLGVLEVNAQGCVAAYREKPILEHRFGIGIYVVEPAVRAMVMPNQRLDMPDLINMLVTEGKPVGCYEHTGSWVDIGTPDEYARVEQQNGLTQVENSELGAFASSLSSAV